MLTANYRLLPESTGVDILEDVDDLWGWLHSNEVAALLFTSTDLSVELDLSRVITAGHSAGGLLSVYLALTYPDEIRAATASYPMFNVGLPVYEPQLSEEKRSTFSATMVPDHIRNMKPGDIVSSDVSAYRMGLSLTATFLNKIPEIYARNSDLSPVHQDRLYQLQRLDAPTTKLPLGGLVMVTGREDDIVPLEVVQRFTDAAREKLKGRQGGDKIVLVVKSGGHGFDGAVRLQEKWLQDALAGAVSAWIA
jgi:acetyl esterase/lipase